MADPNNQSTETPQAGADDSLLTGNPQEGQADESQQTGSVQDSGQESGAPEPPKWVHQLNGDLKANEKVLTHQNINDLVSEYLSYAEKADRLVELPGDDADDDAKKAFLDKLRPESPDAYTFSDESVPDGVQVSKEYESQFRQLAHEVGLTQEQAAKLRDWDLQRHGAQVQAHKQRQEQAIEALKKEWGDNFAANLKEAQLAFKQIAQNLEDDKLAERMVKTGYGNDPDMLKTFYGIWQMIKPDSLIPGSVEGSSGNLTAEEYYPETNFAS